MKSRCFWLVFFVIGGLLVGGCGACDDDDDDNDDALDDDAVDDDSVDDDTTDDDDDLSPPTGWSIEEIVNGDYNDNDIAVDSQARPHIVYGDSRVTNYAFRDQSGWNDQPLLETDKANRNHRLLLDADDGAHVGYLSKYQAKESWFDVNHAYRNGGQWQFELIDDFSASASTSSFCVTPSGRAAVAFDRGKLSRKTTVWSNESGSWNETAELTAESPALFCADENEIVAAGCVVYSSFEDAPDWYDEPGDYLFRAVGSEWVSELVAPLPNDAEDFHSFTDHHLFRDAQGYYHLTYTYARVVDDGRWEYSVHYVSDVSGEWQEEELASYVLKNTYAGIHQAALDSLGRPHLLLWDAEFEELHHVYWTGNDWIDEPLGLFDGLARFALDAENYLHVLFAHWVPDDQYRLYYLTNRPE
ncbi:MAG TPA: hypothetical protein PK961_08685 [bacterium]|nr:hypothetical protein [bacterium]